MPSRGVFWIFEQVVLEAEIDNLAALQLYENLGFIRDKRLHKYYLNGHDAFRLHLLLNWPLQQFISMTWPFFFHWDLHFDEFLLKIVGSYMLGLSSNEFNVFVTQMQDFTR